MNILLSTANSSQQSSDLYSSYLYSVLTPSITQSSTALTNAACSKFLAFPHLTPYLVEFLIDNLNTHVGPGPDGLRNPFLPLRIISNKRLEKYHFFISGKRALSSLSSKTIVSSLFSHVARKSSKDTTTTDSPRT